MLEIFLVGEILYNGISQNVFQGTPGFPDKIFFLQGNIYFNKKNLWGKSHYLENSFFFHLQN